MNGTNAVQHRTIPRHFRTNPARQDLRAKVLEMELEETVLVPDTIFCQAVYNCGYASPDCIGKKYHKCYY